jgi:hypothetical protein
LLSALTVQLNLGCLAATEECAGEALSTLVAAPIAEQKSGDATTIDSITNEGNINHDPSEKNTAPIEIASVPLTVLPSAPQSNLFAEHPILDSPILSADVSPTLRRNDLAALQGGITSSPEVAEGQVDDLTRQILLKEIELERFNVHYTMEVAKQGRWKGWRYGLASEANSLTGLAGSIVSFVERGSHLRNPDHVNNAHQEYANFVPMIGNIIGAGAAVMEFGINEFHDVGARRKGFAPKAAVEHVRSLKSEIDSLLVQRAALTRVEATAPTLIGHAEIDDVEGKVLKDLRDQGLLEFERFHIGARKLLAFQQMQYTFDFLKNTTSAIGYEFGYLSLHRHDRKWNYRGGVMFIISGGLYMGGPILSRVFAKGVGEMHRHRLLPTTQDAENSKLDQLISDHAQLDQLCKDTKIIPSSVERSVEREAIYGLHEKTFQDQIRDSEKKRDKAKLAATQNIFGGLFVGTTKVASGVLFTVAGVDYQGKGHVNNRGTNSNLFAASAAGVPGTVYSILDTLRINVKGEINRHNLVKSGRLPAQLAAKRLSELDTMEARLKRK